MNMIEYVYIYMNTLLYIDQLGMLEALTVVIIHR